MEKFITLKINIEEKCVNCEHMQFPDILEETDYGTCKLTSKRVSEKESCGDHKIYAFWNDSGLGGTIERVETLEKGN